MNFRLDINGLRFLAVTMVVLFHFKIGPSYGGFAGVDVFFVISGFLMQEICSKEMKKHGWVMGFYKKRFNRIYPALLVMSVLAFAVVLATETPDGVKSAFKQAASALTFTSNIYYWITSGGYFSGSSDLNWLLHTWSLSLEWQYYLIFPAIITIGNMLGRYRNAFYLSTIILSLCLCIFISRNHQDASFYLLPTRMWELMLGAYVSAHKFKNNYKRTTEIASILIIVAFCVLVKEGNTWPGSLTLIPTLCAAAVINACVSNESTVFRFSPIQLIGKASYSIYLFHWPVVAYMANNSIEFNPLSSTVGIALSVALGFVSYRYFENIRNLKGIKAVSAATAFSLLAFAVSSIGLSKYWISDRTIKLEEYKYYSDNAIRIKQFGNDNGICFLTTKYNDVSFFDKEKCLTPSSEKKNILLIGDSHAAEFSQAMREEFTDYNVMQATASGCIPIASIDPSSYCQKLINYIYDDFLKNNKVDGIFISANWVAFNEYNLLEKLNASLANKKDAKVYVIGQTKTFEIDFYKIAQKVDRLRIDKLVTKDSEEINNVMIDDFKSTELHYLDVFNLNCIESKCNYFIGNDIPYMFDRNHLTKEWAEVYVKEIKKMTRI
ncbi:acyltransferase family protein [Serratia silvae]|nr:acyltransferase family protein [Serratia silvae]